MVAGKDVCLRRLSKGDRALEVRFNRFLGNDKVTTERIIESWSESTVAAVAGRHVLAIQDTSEIHFNTTPQRPRGNRQGQSPRRAASPDAGGGRRQRDLPRAFERRGMVARRPPHGLA